jgi:hypothetical protein
MSTREENMMESPCNYQRSLFYNILNSYHRPKTDNVVVVVVVVDDDDDYYYYYDGDDDDDNNNDVRNILSALCILLYIAMCSHLAVH